jgi:hypothetical protein
MTFGLLAVLNSALMGWYHNSVSPKAKKGLFPKILVNDVRNLPIIIDVSGVLNNLGLVITQKLVDFNDSEASFTKVLSSEFGKIKLLANWHKLDFTDFVKALKVKLPLVKKDELLELWNKYQPQLAALNEEITALDKEIDQKVYELYGLTLEEIAIVEGA